jgi:16S rRNA U516 pseudouridylate synthase RsuA-like enzyme
MDNTIRLNKFISESGMCSRREADNFIEKGMVRINGSIAKIGSVVRPRDKVMDQWIDCKNWKCCSSERQSHGQWLND